MEMLKYAGIGARATPPDILVFMSKIATYLSDKWELVSGGAEGADSAFEYGCKGKKTIYKANDATLNSIDLASKFHPAWDKCSPYVRRLHGRNALILLGVNLDTPVNFVVCWTPNGLETGGTGLGLRIAREFNIPIHNLYDDKLSQHIKKVISKPNNG